MKKSIYSLQKLLRRTNYTNVFKMTANIENAQKSNRVHEVNRCKLKYTIDIIVHNNKWINLTDKQANKHNLFLLLGLVMQFH